MRAAATRISTYTQTDARLRFDASDCLAVCMHGEKAGQLAR